MSPNSGDSSDNMQVTNQYDIIPNFFLPISVSWENPPALKEEINICEISHPPSASLPNYFFFINNIGDKECF